ncbi:hypothetical protein N800_14875 [Lysobacter daejeonensis GH1-9]|uniref:DUF4124 domain-containing protein n=1 Tax=Lysobacter daejeonensis GH1-9 TaxID=1385517 RepID=A0A0A0EXK6_9GAMM|nr:hypothetical protein [Lysobacter daejeonensis]KGM55249.1 hypothetical protein N800_14875 [Lysobacter daejeonensis GH1-9]
MKTLHATAAAALTLLAASMPVATPVNAGTGIQRCQATDGTTIYTDKPCSVHGATATPMSGELMTRIAREEAMAEAHYDLADASQLLAPAVAPGRRSAAAGCARSATQLAMDLRGAFALGDINRIAESFQWAGMTHREGQMGMERIDRLNDTPLMDARYLDATLGPAGLQLADASTSSGDAGAGIMQLWFGDGGEQRIVDLDVKRYQGCYFVEF